MMRKKVDKCGAFYDFMVVICFREAMNLINQSFAAALDFLNELNGLNNANDLMTLNDLSSLSDFD